MDIDLKKLEANLWQAKHEKTVPDEHVNPYLLNVLLRRLMARSTFHSSRRTTFA